MSDRSGCGLVELTILEVLAELAGGDPEEFVNTASALPLIEDRIGLGPRHGFPVLVELSHPWRMAVPLVALMGDGGDRFFPAAEADMTETRPSHVGELVLDAEAGKLPRCRLA